MPKRHRSLIVVVGSLCAGRLRHLNRIATMNADIRPLVTLTTRTDPWPEDDVWYRLVHRTDIRKHRLNEILTLFTEDTHICAVLMPDAVAISKSGFKPVVGMTYEGIERFLSYLEHKQATQNRFICRAVYLQPEDPRSFSDSLERSYGFDADTADMQTEAAIRESTIPPSAPRFSSFPVPISGTPEDDSRIDRALEQVLTSPAA